MNDTNTNDNQNRTDQTPETNRQESEEKEEKRFPLWVSLLALFGILIVVVIAAIGIVRIAGNAEGNLSRLGGGIADFFRGSERIELDVEDPTIAADEEAVIEINHRNRSAEEGVGNYWMLVDCDEDITATVDGEEVECGSEIDLDGTPTETTLTLDSSAEDRFSDVPVTVGFRSDESEYTSEVILTALNEDVPEDSEDTNGTEDETDDEADDEDPGDDEGTSTPVYQTPEERGTPDLAVAVLALGRLDDDGSFVEDDNIDEDDTAAVRFVISNGGTAPTGSWRYSAILPTSDPEIYNSGPQETLFPGDRIEFTLGFDDIEEDDGEASFYISVDPDNNIKEITDLNNYVRVEFEF